MTASTKSSATEVVRTVAKVNIAAVEDVAEEKTEDVVDSEEMDIVDEVEVVEDLVAAAARTSPRYTIIPGSHTLL
jgi:hypothetical protein